MIREEMKKALPAFKAYADGKIIQLRKKGTVKWVDFLEDDIVVSQYYEYRIKPEPKYRPFENQEECWNEMLKHQPFGWVKSKKSERLFSIGLVFWDNNFNDVYVTFACNEMSSYCSKTMIKDFTFADGTPFGIKEE